jgi:uncharacterized damage-inducible protein DinB
VADHRTPFTVAGERQTLSDFLDYLREAIVRKTEGLDDESLRRSTVPSGTSLLGLVKHLTFVERSWFGWTYAGERDELPKDALEPGDTAASVLAGYRDAIERSRAIVARGDDLDRRCARQGVAPEEPVSLRWVLVHLIEETGRHAGHADIIREQLDGSTGR